MSNTLDNAIETAVEMRAGNQDAQSYVNDLREQVRAGSPRAISQLQDLVNLIVIEYKQFHISFEHSYQLIDHYLV